MASSSFSVDGLISGMNTTAMIDQLMQLESRPLLALQTKQAQIQQRTAALNDLKTKVASLQTSIYSLTLDSYTNAKSATTNTLSTSPNVLIASAGSTAANGSFNVTVSRLATATKVSSSNSIGVGLNPAAKLADAGFSLTPSTGTITIKGTSAAVINIDADTVLSDGVDAAGSNTILAKINNAGIGITASVVNDSDGHPNLLQLSTAAGVKLQIGSGADTSNFLTAANLLDAQVVGDTSAWVKSGAIGAGLVGSTSITINGVTTITRATDIANSAADNAASIAADINNTANSTVTATGNDDGTITLTQKNSGASYKIDVTAAGTGTGLGVGQTANGSDRITSLTRLAGARTSEALTGARLATPIAGLDVDGNGEMKINGVVISYNQADSINTVISRINSSTAGVVASYDALTDKLRFTAAGTGQKSIALEDSKGNFLAATGLLNTEQTLGENALYSIDSVNNGQQLSSASNTVTNIVPGVTLNFQSVSATPVKVTIGQDTSKTIGAIKDFVTKYNAVITQIKEQTAYNSDTKEGGVLLGDSTVRLIDSTLRSMLSGRAFGASGKYQSLADMGVTTGRVGTAVGSGYALQIDETKLNTALTENPAAVAAVLNSFSNTASLTATAGGVESISGSPASNHYSGYYKVTTTTDPANNVKVQFFNSDGTARDALTGTIAAGATNSTLIPGVTLKMKAVLEAGEQTINVMVKAKGIATSLNDYLKDLTSSSGLFANRQESADEETKKLNAQMTDMQARIDAKREALQAKFARMEATLGQLKVQSSALSSQLAGLSSSSV
jgi:flagellar hook-associated protein 2